MIGEAKGTLNGSTTFPLLRATMNYTVNAHHMYTHVWDTVSTDADTSTGTGTGTGSGVSVAGGGAGPGTSPSAPSTSTGAEVGGGGGGSGSGKGFLTLDTPGTSPGAFKSPVSPGKDDRRQTLNVTAVGPFLQRDNCIISIVEEKSTGRCCVGAMSDYTSD